jgi:hypothetical protein
MLISVEWGLPWSYMGVALELPRSYRIEKKWKKYK